MFKDELMFRNGANEKRKSKRLQWPVILNFSTAQTHYFRNEKRFGISFYAKEKQRETLEGLPLQLAGGERK